MRVGRDWSLATMDVEWQLAYVARHRPYPSTLCFRGAEVVAGQAKDAHHVYGSRRSFADSINLRQARNSFSSGAKS